MKKIVIAAACIPAIVSFKTFPASEQVSFADKYWVYESSTVVPAVDIDMDGKPDNTLSMLLEECQKDDARMFKSDGKIMEDFGSVKCDEDEERTEETGEWKYDASIKQITSQHYGTEHPEVLTLREISASRMVVSRILKTKKGEHVITVVYKAG